jgi:hypothetical protein
VITLSTAGVSEAEVTRTVYDQAFAAVKARFPFDEPVPLDVPVVNGYNCYSPVGIFMLLDHGSIGIETPIVETVGDIDDVEFRIDYIREIDVTVRHRDTATGLDVENEVTGTLVANVYWRSQPPDLDVATIETAIWAGESTDGLAGLSCGGEPMESLELDYRLRSDPTFVELSESLGFTDPDGISTTTVSTTDLASGIITVEVEHFWTDQPGDRVRTITKTAQIAVGGLTGRWRVTGEETWRNCTDPLDNGTYGGTGEVTFAQNGDSFMGGGTFPRTSDSIEGEFRRTGRNTFEVSGTVEYVEDYDGWIVRGTSGFVGTGSIVTESIDFTWNGADSSGDTCTFTGKGTGVRQ